MERTFEKLIDINTKIAVLAGGMSNEREVSLRSGKNCLNALHRLGYKNAILIDVDENIVNKLREEKIEVAYNALHGKFGEDGCIQGILEILGIKYNIPELEARQWIKDFNFDEVCRSCNYIALHDDHEVWVDAIYQFKVGE